MTNAELFKKTFGIYSEEFWSYSEKQMLDWINADVTDKNVGDMISRQAAIYAAIKLKVDEEDCTGYDVGFNDGISEVVKMLYAFPSAEQQRKRGKWRFENYIWICSECGMNPTRGMGYVQGRGELFAYCPNCGAEMVKGETDDQKSNDGI